MVHGRQVLWWSTMKLGARQPHLHGTGGLKKEFRELGFWTSTLDAYETFGFAQTWVVPMSSNSGIMEPPREFHSNSRKLIWVPQWFQNHPANAHVFAWKIPTGWRDCVRNPPKIEAIGEFNNYCGFLDVKNQDRPIMAHMTTSISRMLVRWCFLHFKPHFRSQSPLYYPMFSNYP